jgi:hypothetical protein
MEQRQLNALPAGYFINNPNASKSVNYYNNALLPYLGWGSLNAVETLGYSRYNALMARVSRRFANNLSVNFNYTYSKIMDIVDNDSDVVNNPFNIRQNYAPAGYDQTNVVTLDFVYMLPKLTEQAILKQVVNGWELSGMLRSQSGMPISICSNGSLQGTIWAAPHVGAANMPTSRAAPIRDRTASNGSTRPLSPVRRMAPSAIQAGTRSACPACVTSTSTSSRTSTSRRP